MLNDKLFIKKFLEGDATTLKEIYAKSFSYVKHYITSRDGTIKDAEDIFQSALVILYVKLKEKSINIQKFDNYLFTVCKNLWRKENKKKRVTNNDIIPLISEELDMATFYLEQQQWELYKEKLLNISEQCQTLLKMIFEKKTYNEIVEKYNYSSHTVARQRVFKCKSRLIKLIKQDIRYLRMKNKP